MRGKRIFDITILVDSLDQQQCHLKRRSGTQALAAAGAPPLLTLSVSIESRSGTMSLNASTTNSFKRE